MPSERTASTMLKDGCKLSYEFLLPCKERKSDIRDQPKPLEAFIEYFAGMVKINDAPLLSRWLLGSFCIVRKINDIEQMTIGSNKMEESLRRRWEDLDADILKNILSLSGNLPGIVSKVCHSWRLCCWDILFWQLNVIDLSASMATLGNVDSFTGKSFKLRGLIPENVDLLEGFKDIDYKLMKLLESTIGRKDAFGISLDQWRLSIRSVFVPEDLEISDEHLLYIAKRTPRLEGLALHATSRVTPGGFARAVNNWRYVKHISLGQISSSKCFTRILEDISKACHELLTLKVSGRLHFPAGVASTASKNLPIVEKRKFEVAYLLGEVMNSFLSNCLKLEEIHFDNSFIDYEYTGLLEWTRLSFTIKFGQGGRDRKWHFDAGSKGIVQATESSLLKEFKLWMNEQPPWVKLGPWITVCEHINQPEG